MATFQTEKALVLSMFSDMASADVSQLNAVLSQYTADNYQFLGCHPFNELDSIESVVAEVWQPLRHSFHALQRRQDVFMAGESEIDGRRWVMSMGHFMGLFDKDWLGLSANGKVTMIRYAEFHCVQDGKIHQSSFFIDIIDIMHQMGLRPLPLQTGASITVPGPLTQDGLLFEPCPAEDATKTLEVLNLMVNDLTVLNKTGNDTCPPELLAKRWHEDMVWYGPAGIGTTFTIKRYQKQHQYPFRLGLKDKVFNGHVARFAEGKYACFFGWPNLSNTPKGGFLGLPGGEVRADMRVVDVYRRDGEKLAENWVIMDVLHWLKMQGLDVLKRTAEISNPTWL